FERLELLVNPYLLSVRMPTTICPTTIGPAANSLTVRPTHWRRCRLDQLHGPMPFTFDDKWMSRLPMACPSARLPRLEHLFSYGALDLQRWSTAVGKAQSSAGKSQASQKVGS